MLTELTAGFKDMPGIAALAIISLIPLAVWVVSVVQWMVTDEIDALLGIVCLLVGFTLALIVVMPSEPVHAYYAFGGILALMIVFPLARRQLHRRALERFDLEQLERAYEQLAEKPHNSIAMFKVAEGLYARGLVGPALGVADHALMGLPRQTFPTENKTVDKWKKVAGDENGPAGLKCLECGKPNDPGELFCHSCGEPYLLAYASGKWMGPSLARKLVSAFAAAAVALVGLPLTLSRVENKLIAAMLCLTQAAAVVWLLWSAFWKRQPEQ